MQRYRLKNNGVAFPNQSTPNWERVAAGMAQETLALDQLRGLAAGTPVKIRGTAQPGPTGPLTAPFSGTACVWYRCYLLYGRKIRLQTLPPEGRLSDIMLVAQPANGLLRSRDNADEISDQPFRVVDGGGAAVTIAPRVADINSDSLTRNRIVNSRFGFVQQLLVEWIVPIGAEVVALGTVGPGADLDASAAAFQFVSTRPERAIIDRAQAGAGEHDSSVGQFRFVSRMTRVSRGIRTGTLVFAVVVSVVLVIAILYAIVF